MPRVAWTQAAEADLEAIWAHAGRKTHSPRAAESLVETIRLEAERAASEPELGTPRPDLAEGLRVLRVGSYVVLYQAADEGICVVRVFEGHREYPALFDAE